MALGIALSGATSSLSKSLLRLLSVGKGRPQPESVPDDRLLRLEDEHEEDAPEIVLRRSSKSDNAPGPEYVEEEDSVPPLAMVIGEGTGDASTDEDTDMAEEEEEAELPTELAGEKASSSSGVAPSCSSLLPGTRAK